LAFIVLHRGHRAGLSFISDGGISNFNDADIRANLAFHICSREMDIDIRHGAVPFPSSHQSKLHLIQAGPAPVPPGKICEAGMADRVEMDGLRDAGSHCNMSEFVLHSTHIEAAGPTAIAAGRYKERCLCICPQGMHVDPGLEIRD